MREGPSGEGGYGVTVPEAPPHVLSDGSVLLFSRSPGAAGAGSSSENPTQSSPSRLRSRWRPWPWLSLTLDLSKHVFWVEHRCPTN